MFELSRKGNDYTTRRDRVCQTRHNWPTPRAQILKVGPSGKRRPTPAGGFSSSKGRQNVAHRRERPCESSFPAAERRHSCSPRFSIHNEGARDPAKIPSQPSEWRHKCRPGREHWVWSLTFEYESLVSACAIWCQRIGGPFNSALRSRSSHSLVESPGPKGRGSFTSTYTPAQHIL
jgi:hypothetical protein